MCPTYINTGMFDGAKGILFTPMLKQEDVVAADVDGDAEGEPFVVMPWTSKMNKVLSGVLPVRLRDIYLRRVGVYNSMDEFRWQTLARDWLLVPIGDAGAFGESSHNRTSTCPLSMTV